MADRYEMAFLRNALSATGVEEETALVNLMFQRLLTGNFTVSSAGVVTVSFGGLFGDGTVGAPSMSFTLDTDTGFYRSGANTMVWVTGGGPLLTGGANLSVGTGVHLLWTTDNGTDIGASGANRPRDLYLGRNAVITGTLAVTSTSAFTGAVTLTGGLNTPLVVAQGGTGAATLTNHGVVIGQGTSAVAITTAGTAAQVLTSNGAAADPTFQDITGLDTLQIEALS